MDSGDPETDLVKYSNCFHDGEKLAQHGLYPKAIQRYTQALEAVTNANGLLTIDEAKHCLTSRAKCYLAMSDHKNAYLDAERSLEDDPNFVKGIHMKAEALYMKGEFEYALMYFHRGNKMRPELSEFSRGISKSTEAIENSVGSPEDITLEKKGDLTLFTTLPTLPSETTKTQPKKKADSRKAPPTVAPQSERSVKALLGELYADRRYIEELLEDPTFVTNSATTEEAEPLRDLIASEKDYLEKRTEFWRQQKPIYAIKNERARNLGMTTTRTLPGSATGNEINGDLTREDIWRGQEEVEYLIVEKNTEEALAAARELRGRIDDSTVPSRTHYLAMMSSLVGNALFDLKEYAQALTEYERVLENATLVSNPELTTLALTNMGRCHAAVGNFASAVDAWSKVANVDAKVQVWLFHEIGRCHLQLYRDTQNTDHLTQAMIQAQSCHRAGSEQGDRRWEMAAKILQAEVAKERGEYAKAAELFDTGAHDAGFIRDMVTHVNCAEASKACMELAADKAAADAAGVAADASTAAGL
eukprot:m.173021 g.173021  ORF g.173021 m.173021 type:complete len:531 (+) comp13627_c0_seq1:49-1641(+)